jgi:IclR family acetate operon transcriptional repressor
MPRPPTRNVTNVRAVERAIEILRCFSADKPDMSVLEIQEKVPLSRPTLYRLLHTLAAQGLVRVHGEPQRFSLDYEVGRLAQNWMSGIDPIRTGRPILERLRDTSGETAALFMLRSHLRLCVLELTTPHVLNIERGVGENEHISRGASGKAILAYILDEEITPILRTLPKGMDAKKLQAELIAIRRDGYAISHGEVFVGAIAIAAPYFDHTGHVVGSVGVFGPEARLDEKWAAKTIRSVVASAAELSSALGYASPGRSSPARP